MAALYNRVNKQELKKRLQEESIKRITFSFYKYVEIENPNELRDKLFEQWASINCFGRIYLAKEGINAQMNVPEQNWERFKELLYADKKFTNVPLKVAMGNHFTSL